MHRTLVLFTVTLLTSQACADEGLPARILDAVKDATVLITTKVETDQETGTTSGSGFLIRVDGPTGYVVTNHHVIRMAQPGDAGPRVTFRVGTKAERTVPAEIVASVPDPDLAVLRVAGVPDLPQPIDISQPAELTETRPVFVFGFPFGRGLVPERGNLSVVVSRGSISSVRRTADGEATAVLIDGALNPGNSGGPVVDVRGHLAGIAVAVVRGAHIGVAIAPAELRTMLAGRPDGLSVAPRTASSERLELSAAVPVFDPLDQIRAVTVLYVPGQTVDLEALQEGKVWKPMPGARKTELKHTAGRFEGSLILPPPRAEGGVDLTYQIAFVNERGNNQYLRPGHYLFAGDPTQRAGIIPWGDWVDTDNDSAVRLERGGIRFDVPGSYHDLNGGVGKTNAPRVVQEVDGDFVAQVRVMGEFRPDEPSTRQGGLPYNGAGMVVWLDADHFIRAERGAVLRDGNVGASFAFENHEQARVVARHNGFLEAGDVYLKLERRGARLSAFYGTDGMAWAETEPMNIAWPARLKLGLHAINSSFSPLSVRFEEFTVRKVLTKNSH
jgi:S1-C subfamily serine protease/regulation of enolase protein 1 (concanavalin A-like superfamily)